jgi:hypothetical protein
MVRLVPTVVFSILSVGLSSVPRPERDGKGLRRGLSDDEYDVFVIEPQSPEPAEVDYPSAWREA